MKRDILTAFVFTGALLVAAPAPASESTAFKVAATGPVIFPVCYDFMCQTRETVTLSDKHWDTVLEIFDEPAVSARDERLRIQAAIGRMEQLAGFHTPTYRDMPRNFSSRNSAVSELPGQMDCVDESINTTTYLKLLEARGLLRHHRVLPRAYRRALLNQHWAGQVEEIASGERYIIDSWFLENGRQPYIVHSDDWHDLSPFNRFRRPPEEKAKPNDRISLSRTER